MGFKAIIRHMVTGKRVIATVLVLVAAVVMVRLGFWQIDRLHQRIRSNAQIQAEISQPALNLNSPVNPSNLLEMEYRPVVVRGVYNFAEQVLLRNRSYQGQPGGELLTPLQIEGTSLAVVVDRGWIPLQDAMSGKFSAFDEPGTVTVQGSLQLTQEDYPLGMVVDPILAPGKGRLAALNLVNLDRIDAQVSEKLLPVYIQENPSQSWTQMPYRLPSAPDLSNGPHLSYAIQWFSFAAIALIGYPILVRRQLLVRGVASATKTAEAPGREGTH